MLDCRWVRYYLLLLFCFNVLFLNKKILKFILVFQLIKDGYEWGIVSSIQQLNLISSLFCGKRIVPSKEDKDSLTRIVLIIYTFSPHVKKNSKVTTFFFVGILLCIKFDSESNLRIQDLEIPLNDREPRSYPDYYIYILFMPSISRMAPVFWNSYIL